MKQGNIKGVPIEITVLNRHFASPDKEVFEETKLCFDSVYNIRHEDESGINTERLDINIPSVNNYLPPAFWEKLQNKQNVFTLRLDDIIVLDGQQWVIGNIEDRSMRPFGKHFRVRASKI